VEHAALLRAASSGLHAGADELRQAESVSARVNLKESKRVNGTNAPPPVISLGYNNRGYAARIAAAGGAAAALPPAALPLPPAALPPAAATGGSGSPAAAPPLNATGGSSSPAAASLIGKKVAYKNDDEQTGTIKSELRHNGKVLIKFDEDNSEGWRHLSKYSIR
jgi:hypothetical protein